jgi:DNA-binding transcriptional ArsR family regulator
MGMPTDEEVAWCDRVAEYFAVNAAMPPITGRTMAWLMICDPAEQSPADLSAALGVSRASLTSTLRLLTSSGLVRRSTRRGSRATYYRIVDEAWAAALRHRMHTLGVFISLVEAGQHLVGTDPARSSRLHAVDEVYRWFADEIEPLWQRWETRRKETRA